MRSVLFGAGARRARHLLLLAGLMLAALPAASALADTTIGQTGGGTACHPFNGAVAGDGDYVVPSSGGRITSFSFQSASANAGNRIDFLVLRPGGGSNYTVVGKTGVKTLQGPGLETFSPRHEIAAQGGDILGFWVVSPPNVGFPNCIHIVAGHGGIHATANQTADPNVGDTLKFPLSTQSDDLNESAKLVTRKHHHHHHHRPSRCRLTKITGTADNRTGMALTVVAVGHGPRDTWCRAAAGKVPVRSSATIGMAGSNSSGTSLEVTYRLQNGDQIRFEAGVDGEAIDRVVGSSLVPVDRGHAGCSFVREVRSRRRFECEAELKLDALTKHAVVVFTVAKAPKSPAVRSPQFCGSSSEIYGFTINNTDQPITEEEIGHGPTNSWCKLVSTDPVPPHSQNDWNVGDDSIFATSVDLTYSIPAPPPPPPRPSPGPDGFAFHAHTPILGSGGGASCEDEQSIYPNSGAFKCLTSYTEGFDRTHPSVDFVIAPSS